MGSVTWKVGFPASFLAQYLVLVSVFQTAHMSSSALHRRFRIVSKESLAVRTRQDRKVLFGKVVQPSHLGFKRNHSAVQDTCLTLKIRPDITLADMNPKRGSEPDFPLVYSEFQSCIRECISLIRD